MSTATAGSTIAIGYNADATAFAATAVGRDTQAFGNSSVAMGNGAHATGFGSAALGAGSQATEPDAVAAFAQAVKRGVDVRVMVPSADVSDMPLVQHAARCPEQFIR